MSKISKAILIAIIVAAGFALIVSANIHNYAPNKYANEAVRVLEKYKNFDIDAKEAAKRLDSLMDEVKAEETHAKDKDEKHSFTMLWLELMSIHTKLYHYGSASGYEVDEAIQAIKKHY